MKKIFKRIVGYAIALFMIISATNSLVLTLLAQVPENHVVPIAVTVMLIILGGAFWARDGYTPD